MNARNGIDDRTQDGGPLLFQAELRPHRSLSRRNFGLLLGFVAATCFVSGLLFWSMGAWPVTGFFGLDLLAVHLAFRANYRAARAREIVELNGNELLIRKVAANGATQEFRFNPYWVRLEVERLPEWGVTRMALASHGRRLSIGSFLPPDDREPFLQSLQAALAAARA